MKSKASIKKELRKLWYEIGHKRFKKCLICEDSPVEIHHAISSSHILTAYDLKNQVPLCSDHHRISRVISPHNNKGVWMDYLKEWEPELYEYITENENRIANSLPMHWYEEKLAYLKKALREVS